MKKETKINTLFFIIFFMLGVIFGIIIGRGIYTHKIETTPPTTQQTTSSTSVETSQSTSSSTIEETPQTTTNETVKATAPDTVFTVLLKVNKEGGDYLVNEGYTKVSKGYAQAPLKAYIEDYSTDVNEANAYGMVQYRFIWVREVSKNELLNSGYFEEVNYE